MTPQEKQRETRQKHKEAQQRKRAAAKEDLELIRKGLQDVPASEEATPAEKLESSKLLLELDRRTGTGF